MIANNTTWQDALIWLFSILKISEDAPEELLEALSLSPLNVCYYYC